jgi:carbamoyl-phosphate synthase large subunit
MTRSLLKDPELVLVGCDASKYFIHLALTPNKELVPRCSETDAYLAAINAICRKYSVDLIMPNNSLEAHVLSAHRQHLEAAVFLPSTECLDSANSKWRSWHIWNQAGLPVPKTWLIQNSTDLEQVFSQLAERPIWVRGAGIPGKGIGGAALPCKSLTQAEAWIDFHHGWGAMIASEFLPGKNLTWIGLFEDGRLITSQGRERMAYVISHVSPSGVTGAPSISKTVHRDDLNELGLKAALAIDTQLTGVSFLDFKCNAQGLPFLTEMNAGRFGTTHHFYTEAGLNLPVLYAHLALGRPLPFQPKQYNAVPAGKLWIRTLDAGPVLLDESEI